MKMPATIQCTANHPSYNILAGSFLRLVGTRYEDNAGHSIPAWLVIHHYKRGQFFFERQGQLELWMR